ncbi:MAG: aminotransferase class I/II-fold pyridoxal phosphate-dependent enzyme [Planctomycetaceae bacterium]
MFVDLRAPAPLSPDDLAIESGRPAFRTPLHVGRPNLPDSERLLERFRDILERRWFTNNGPYVQEFERHVAQYLGVEHCVATCNGTVALELLARGLGLTGEVIVPSFTFIATPHSLQWQQITPVFCDIQPDSHTIDPARVEDLITPRTTGILGVHTWGRPCAIEALGDIARRRKLALYFDASHAFGCSYGGRRIGNFGEAECFSFHATKFINTFEGGAIVTNNAALAQRLRLMKNFGFAGEDCVTHIGTNGKMNELSAAMGITCLEHVAELIEANRERYRQYAAQLQSIPGVGLVRHDEREERNFQYVVVEIDEAAAGLARDDLYAVLRAENVLARRYFSPGAHRMEPYATSDPHAGSQLPNTERACTRVLSLPAGAGIEPEAVSSVCRIIALAVQHAARVRARVRERAESKSPP